MHGNIKRVYPDREPVEMMFDYPIWQIYYDIDPDAEISTKNGVHGAGERYALPRITTSTIPRLILQEDR